MSSESNKYDWLSVQLKVRPAILQIFASQGTFNYAEPYQSVSSREARGSGFLITKDGYFLTNAHVAASMLTVCFRNQLSGHKNLQAELIAICPSKDVALLKVKPESMADLGDFEPLEFADDHKLKQTEQLLSLSYPMGRELTCTIGTLTGYEATGADNDDGSQSYLQFDTAISSGSSGSPLLNHEGKVVGISSAGLNNAVAQNMNYAIPSRVVLSILREMFSREQKNSNDLNIKLVRPPCLGLIFQRITQASFELAGITDPEEQNGLRIQEKIPGTPYDDVMAGDILQSIEYADPYILDESFDVEFYRSDICVRCHENPDTVISISRYGNIKLLKRTDDSEEVDETNFSKGRKASLAEVLDTIPINTPLTLQVLRPSVKTVGYTTGPFKNPVTQAIKKLYPPFDELDYVIFSGCVWISLSTNILNVLGESKNLCTFVPYKSRDKPRVMLSKIFPDNDVRDTEALEPTDILSKVNGIEVLTLDDFRKELLNSSKYVILSFRSEKELVIDLDKAISQDKIIHNNFKIKPSDFTLELWSE